MSGFKPEMFSPQQMAEFINETDPEKVRELIGRTIDQAVTGMRQASISISNNPGFYEFILTDNPSIDRESFTKGIAAAISSVEGTILTVESSMERLKQELYDEVLKYANTTMN